MGTRASMWAALVAGALACVLSAAPAHAQLSEIQKKCQAAIAKSGLKYLQTRMKVLKKCKDAELKAPGSCDTTKRDEDLTKAEGKLAQGLDKGCTFSAANFANIGFPGQCSDANQGDGFTTADLKICMLQSHAAIADQLFALHYDATVSGPLDAAYLACQKTVGQAGQKVALCHLKRAQKCRLDIIEGKLAGVLPENCALADGDQKTFEADQKCHKKTEQAIIKKCINDQVSDLTVLKLCEPDQTDAALAANCIATEYETYVDNPAKTAPADVLDYEFAAAGICGNNRVDTLDEECDGTADAACPGQCGSAEVPDGYFACLCKTPPVGALWSKRERVVEYANADLDNGWTGTSHDSGIVQGGGYVSNLYDCDGGGTCIVGPSCSDAPHAPCGPVAEAASGTTGNSICAALGQGTCRKDRIDVGPHCYKDIQKKCNPKLANDPVCNQPGDFCVKSFHGLPLPLSAGGVSVCVVNVFSEDVVGTTNVNDGTSAVRLRENSITHSSVGSANKPCPVCGGFCAGDRERCDADADCAPESGPCITDAVCSDGPNQDRACRRTEPFGGPSELFGTTSEDCPPNAAADISSKGLDILWTPIATGVVPTRLPGFACDALGFQGNACLGGTNQGRPCTAASECPAGACTGQCFCPSGGGAQQKPNSCEAACVGGGNEAGACDTDGDCPDGFCHQADCRANPADTDSAQEGMCTVGPALSTCSFSTFKSCLSDADCQGLNCTFCKVRCSGGANGGADCSTNSECPGGVCAGETCVTTNQQCFVNSGYFRSGTPGVPERTTAATYCIAGTSSSSINNVSGTPGPGAITQPIRVITVP